MKTHPEVRRITERIAKRSEKSRTAYLTGIESEGGRRPRRLALGCTNLAHGFAAAPERDKGILKQAENSSNIGIVSAYNDMLSAHQPLADYPAILKAAVTEAGGVCQFAGGVPAMCDGVTQGMAGMELSLFSRDVIAMATAIALSHNMFDGALYLGVCDKIVPGLLMGALRFGHLPAIFVPAGPMPSGIGNSEKAKTRQLFAQKKVGRDALLDSEARSYHCPGTCTFYGTANSNQMLMEIMGLHVPGAAFVNPGTPLRKALTAAAGKRITEIAGPGENPLPVGRLVNERTLVNAIVGLLTTGGSTNHTIHLIAIAGAAGIQLNWDDFNDLSAVVPQLARIYPNGDADVNQFHAAGGTGYLIGQLLDGGLLHPEVETVFGKGLSDYRLEPFLEEGNLAFRPAPDRSGDRRILTSADRPFSPNGGIRLLTGNLGRAVVKVSAVPESKWVIEAPAAVFHDQQALQEAFEAGDLDRDFIAVVRYQGPRANGMPELHKLTPPLGVLQDRGYQVALVTDGRMSGASGKVPAAIHVTPESLSGGPLAKVRSGDRLRLDCHAGTLDALVDPVQWEQREAGPAPDLSTSRTGCGRELFASLRQCAQGAEEGAVSLYGNGAL